jgi:hypothetical protein
LGVVPELLSSVRTISLIELTALAADAGFCVGVRAAPSPLKKCHIEDRYYQQVVQDKELAPPEPIGRITAAKLPDRRGTASLRSRMAIRPDTLAVAVGSPKSVGVTRSNSNLYIPAPDPTDRSAQLSGRAELSGVCHLVVVCVSNAAEMQSIWG